MSDTIRLTAHAKINLRLVVGRLRGDGFHEIHSVMHNISLADSIEIEREEAIVVSCDDQSVPDGESNLAWKAAALLRDETGSRDGCNIRIEKRIPAAAGLGGGSADAAATLIGLNTFWKTGLSQKQLGNLAAALGSDVPFFIHGGAAIATGRGECIESISPLPDDLEILLITPAVEISSSFAYKELDHLRLTRFSTETMIGSTPELGPDWREILRSPYNSLEDAVLAAYPLVMEARRRVSQHCPAGAIMSGSGPSVFGVLARDSDASNSELLSEFSGCRLAEIVRPVPFAVRFESESEDR